MTLGQQIKAGREKVKLTQEALAMRAGVVVSTIQSMESGRFDPSLMSLLKVIRVLKIQVQIEIPGGVGLVSVTGRIQ